MSHSKHHLMALLPLMTILSVSPMKLTEKSMPTRSIATESTYPKYEEKSSKINKDALYKDEEITAEVFDQKADEYRKKLMKSRREFKAEEVDAEKVKIQNQTIDDIVIGLVLIEQNYALAKEAKRIRGDELSICEATIEELKIVVESLLIDQQENEFFVLSDKVKKEEAQSKVTATEVEKTPTTEVAKVTEETEKPEAGHKKCEDENKVLTEQVTSLVAENKKIMDTMMSMMELFLKQSQSNFYLPYMSGPQLASSIAFPQPITSANGNWVYYPEGMTPKEAPVYGDNSNPLLNYNLQPNTAPQFSQQYEAMSYFNYPTFQSLQNAQPFSYQVGTFGPGDNQYFFGDTEFNRASTMPNADTSQQNTMRFLFI